MSSGQKVAFSFLTTLLLFAGFIVVAQFGLLSHIETRFYKQAIVSEKQQQIDQISESCNSYISNILATLQTDEGAYLKQPSIKTFAETQVSDFDFNDRSNLTMRLKDDLPGLEGIRLLGTTGRTIHYSTFTNSDVLSSSSTTIQYKNYPDVVNAIRELPPETLVVDDGAHDAKVIFDKTDSYNRIIFCCPYFTTDNAYFGTMVFYVNAASVEKKLIEENLLSFGDSLIMIVSNSKGGFIQGVPKSRQSEFIEPILKCWRTIDGNQNSFQNFNLEKILEDDEENWLLLTSKVDNFVKVAAVYKSTVFEMPQEVIYLIYLCVFTTLLLVSFLLFSLKRDYVTVIKAKIRRVQAGLITEYLENKEREDWAGIDDAEKSKLIRTDWEQKVKQLERRKAELSDEIKKSIGGKSKKYGKLVDAYLDSCWEDIIYVIGPDTKKPETSLNGASIDEIRRVLEEVLQTTGVKINGSAPSVTLTEAVDTKPEVRKTPAKKPVPPVEEVEELDDAEPLDAVEELDDVEPLEEVEELGDAEPLEEVEELDDVEPLEEVEELGDAEPLEEVEELDDAEPLEEVEELGDAEPLEEVEELDDVEPLEEVEEVGDAEPLEEVEELGDAEPLDAVEELDDVESLEEVEELGDAEPLEAPAPVVPHLDLPPAPPAPPRVEREFQFEEPLTIGGFVQPQRMATVYFVPAKPFSIEKIVLPYFVEEAVIQEPETIPTDAVTEEIITDSVTEEIEEPVPEPVEELEELDDLLPADNQFFSMTGFGSGNAVLEELKDEETETANSQVFIETEGVCSISEKVDYSGVVQDMKFKALVDSVLNQN
ncbi:MAG: hypothetical protein MJ162_07020 [Treponema sp.]|nr:hypothetical protein [Treponema sp.]